MAAGGGTDDAFPRFSVFLIDGPGVDTPVLVREEKTLAPPKLLVCWASHAELAASFAFRSWRMLARLATSAATGSWQTAQYFDFRGQMWLSNPRLKWPQSGPEGSKPISLHRVNTCSVLKSCVPCCSILPLLFPVARRHLGLMSFSFSGEPIRKNIIGRCRKSSSPLLNVTEFRVSTIIIIFLYNSTGAD